MVSASVANSATPRLAVTEIRAASNLTSIFSIASLIRFAIATAPRTSVFGKTMPNSSPPQRATQSRS